ncbi:hypothetical protein [Chryseobacterium koreense]|uniref:Polysaccharide biosynthesis protein n=1 Tax=Chryseobacterium koreense CCUG 49689 TaxID=1304281 RepID=A0A0J7IS70_9FLAO|nr:hypothetical protein [Chryseobacterium koreense]KMQ68659.1 hypothetical protein ACM44_14650 [Chryseobacterium koreense CCUG 49689]MBB5333570.1 hypothetical protein [Chryseobacterium koreense]
MKRALIYFLLGTAISFLLNYFLLGSKGWQLELYYGCSFGAAWGIAYYLDNERFSLAMKFLISFAAMAVLVGAGMLIFGLALAVPSVIKFSTVFVAYYLIASFRATKSLRK